MTDEQRFVELMNDFGIKIEMYKEHGCTIYDIPNNSYALCEFKFDEDGKSMGIMCAD